MSNDKGPGGRAPVSFSLAGRGAAPKRPALSRPGAAFDADDEHEHAARTSSAPAKRRRDDDRAPPAAKPEARVIPLAGPSDWREERKRRMGLLDRHAPALGSLASMRRPGAPNGDQPIPQSVDSAPERAFTEPQLRGLQVRQRDEAARERSATPPAAEAGSSPEPNEVVEPELAPGADPTDEDAIKGLLADASGETERARASRRVIPQVSEEDILRNDVDTRPEAPTLQEYSATPIEEFGAAMLRGMGWKEGEGVGRNRKGPTSAPEVKHRAALLGLGAKERPAPSHSGPHSRGHRDSRPYIPVVRRDERDRAHGSGHGHRDDTYARSHRERSDRYSDDAYRRRDERRREERHNRRDDDYEYRRRYERGDDRHSYERHSARSYSRRDDDYGRHQHG